MLAQQIHYPWLAHTNGEDENSLRKHGKNVNIEERVIAQLAHKLADPADSQDCKQQNEHAETDADFSLQQFIQLFLCILVFHLVVDTTVRSHSGNGLCSGHVEKNVDEHNECNWEKKH